jgi:hypothetical protein
LLINEEYEKLLDAPVFLACVEQKSTTSGLSFGDAKLQRK